MYNKNDDNATKTKSYYMFFYDIRTIIFICEFVSFVSFTLIYTQTKVKQQ